MPEKRMKHTRTISITFEEDWDTIPVIFTANVVQILANAGTLPPGSKVHSSYKDYWFIVEMPQHRGGFFTAESIITPVIAINMGKKQRPKMPITQFIERYIRGQEL